MKKIIFILTIIIYSNISFAQISTERQVFGTTGNLTNTGAIIASSNVGETVISTFSQSTLIVTQGFEQPDTMMIIGINSLDDSIVNISAYPNPITNQVILAFSLNQEMEIGIDIYNELGQQMRNHLQLNIQDNYSQEINFADFALGNYIIIVKSNDGKLYRSFKVQKTN